VDIENIDSRLGGFVKRLRILSWNVNGIRAAYRKGFLEWFTSENPDILCLQETKAWKEQLPEELTDMKDYNAYFAESVKKGYSGVVIYSKNEPNEVGTGIGIDRFDTEGRVVWCKYKNFFLINVYFPNGKASKERLKYKMDFYDTFLEYVNLLRESGEKILICGDFNTAHKEIDLYHPKENSKTSGFLPEEREWIDSLIEHGFSDTFRMFNQEPKNYTWWDYRTRARDRNIGWRIDYFFVSENMKDIIESAFIKSDVMGSDHCPIGVDIRFEQTQ
jgi:exodeoxyribonuclease-3